MKYQPNFTDPRVRDRCVQSIDFVERSLSATQPRRLGTRYIDRNLGHSGRSLGQWLRRQLLTPASTYFNPLTGQCKTFTLNTQGLTKLKQSLGIEHQPAMITAEIQQQLITGNFDYDPKNNREYHALQYQPKSKKRPLLSQYGYRYEYDICCAAHTLILQHAQHLGMTATCEHLTAYVKNRSDIRRQIAIECAITEDQAKFVLTALLQGAFLSHYADNSILLEFNRDHAVIDRLKNNKLIENIRADIRQCWLVIKPSLSLGTYTDCNGHSRGVRISARHKSGVYRDLESQVRRVIVKYLKKNKVRHFFEHDGWTSDQVVDPLRLCWEVKKQTGFEIELDWAILEDL